MTLGEFKEWCVKNKVLDKVSMAICTTEGGYQDDITLDMWPINKQEKYSTIVIEG